MNTGSTFEIGRSSEYLVAVAPDCDVPARPASHYAADRIIGRSCTSVSC